MISSAHQTNAQAAPQASYHSAMMVCDALRTVLALSVLITCLSCIDAGRPEHSAICSASLKNDGTAEFRFFVGKSGKPRVLILEVPAGQSPWPANYQTDDTKYSMSLAGPILQIGDFQYRVVEVIELPSDLGNTYEIDSKVKLAHGGLAATLRHNPPGFPGNILIEGYQLAPDLISKARSGHLVAATADPDNTVKRLWSMAPE